MISTKGATMNKMLLYKCRRAWRYEWVEHNARSDQEAKKDKHPGLNENRWEKEESILIDLKRDIKESKHWRASKLASERTR